MNLTTSLSVNRRSILCALICLGCSGGASDLGTAEDAGIDLGPRWTLPVRALCEESYGPIETGAWVRETSLTEISGMVASPSREHVLWMHNDAGDDARLYAVGIDGADRGRITLPIDAGLGRHGRSACPVAAVLYLGG